MHGGGAELIAARGLVEARLAGVRATLWPWGEDIAIVDGLRQPALPERPWIWDEGRLLISIEAVEALTGGRVATRFRPEDLPIRAEPARDYRNDLGERPSVRAFACSSIRGTAAMIAGQSIAPASRKRRSRSPWGCGWPRASGIAATTCG